MLSQLYLQKEFWLKITTVYGKTFDGESFRGWNRK